MLLRGDGPWDVARGALAPPVVAHVLGLGAQLLAAPRELVGLTLELVGKPLRVTLGHGSSLPGDGRIDTSSCG
jgi:hypothetical protein